MKKENVESLKKGLVYAIQADYAEKHTDRLIHLNGFLEWLNPQGWELAESILDNSFPKELSPEWRRLAKGICIWRGDKLFSRHEQGTLLSSQDDSYRRYVEELRLEGKELMIKGYQGESFSTEEMERLWEYRIWCECKILRVPYRPYELGLHALGPSCYLPLGYKVPELRMLKMEQALISPDYTEAPHADYFKLMELEACDEFFTWFQGYTLEHTDGNLKAFGKNEAMPQGDGVVHIQEHRGSKPVLLVLADAMDTLFAQVAPILEHLHQSYHNHVNIYWVNMELWDFLIHGPTTRNYFKPYVGNELPGHAESYEDRARMAKKVYMTYPSLTYPCLLDNMSGTITNLFQAKGGESNAVLIDKNGHVAWQSSSTGWVYGETIPPQRGMCPQFPWANMVEQEIRKLLANQGEYLKNQEPFDTVEHRSGVHRINEGLQKDGSTTMYLLGSPVTSVDNKNRTLSIQGRPSTFSVMPRGPDYDEYFNPPYPMTIYVPKTASIKAHGVAIDFESIEVGEVIFGQGFIQTGHDTYRATDMKLWGRKLDIELKPTGDSYLLGKLLSYNTEKKELVMQPLLPVEHMKGKQWIEEEKDRITLIDHAKENYDTLQKWIARDNKNIIITVSDDTLFYHNGKNAHPSNFQTGDTLCVWYHHRHAGKEVLPSALIRASARI